MRAGTGRKIGDIPSRSSRNGDLQCGGGKERKTDGTRDDFGVPMIASRFSATETSAAVTIPAVRTELSSRIVFLSRSRKRDAPLSISIKSPSGKKRPIAPPSRWQRTQTDVTAELPRRIPDPPLSIKDENLSRDDVRLFLNYAWRSQSGRRDQLNLMPGLLSSKNTTRD